MKEGKKELRTSRTIICAVSIKKSFGSQSGRMLEGSYLPREERVDNKIYDPEGQGTIIIHGQWEEE